MNYKTQARNNEAALIDKVSTDLQIDKSQMHCRYITSRIQEKYSVSHKENRVYNHKLYEISIDHLSEIFPENDFLKNGKHFYWMTLSEMEQDDNIAKKNLDVIDFVKERPILSLVITSISTIIINVLSSLLYELLKSLF